MNQVVLTAKETMEKTVIDLKKEIYKTPPSDISNEDQYAINAIYQQILDLKEFIDYLRKGS